MLFGASLFPGKWVVTPNYVLDSIKNGSWLAEGSYEVAIFTSSSAAFYPVRQWRENVSKGRITGAFQGWRVLLMVQEPTRKAMFKRWAATEILLLTQDICVQLNRKFIYFLFLPRLLKAGRAEVYNCPPPTYTSITHVMAKPVTENSNSHNAPCYPVSHIVQHLFGVSLSHVKNKANRLSNFSSLIFILTSVF